MVTQVKDLNIYRKHYHKDIEKKETTLDHIDYAIVTFKTENIVCLNEFENEYVIELIGNKKIQVSKEDYDNVKSLYK